MKGIIIFAMAISAVCATPAMAHTVQYAVSLNGANEAPPNASLGSGTGLITFDLDLFTMNVNTSFSGLTGNVSAAHIHCCTANPGAGNVGVASPTPTFPGFPSGGTSGSYNQTFDLTLNSSWNAAFINNNGGTVSTAFTAFLNGIDSGKAYLNIHTNAFPGGEIRGFLTPAAVPVPAAVWLMGSAMLGLIGFKRKSAVK